MWNLHFARYCQLYILRSGYTRSQSLTPKLFLTMKFLVPFVVLLGIAWLVSISFGFTIDQSWPLIPASAGIAGFYAGIRRNNRFSANFVIPSLAFLLLSVFFLLFSFNIITISFVEFISAYWLFLALFCIAAVLISLVSYKRAGKKVPRPV